MEIRKKLKNDDIENMKLETKKQFGTKTGIDYKFKINGKFFPITEIYIRYDTIGGPLTILTYIKNSKPKNVVKKGLPQMDIYLKTIRVKCTGGYKQCYSKDEFCIYSKNDDVITGLSEFSISIGNKKMVTEAEIVLC